ncbi:MAG: hypothetical protein H0V17_30415 [Deltaproteobacteria bacterium]|nr:hypothetical protein [Deltaproteobacteria bacterium]
MTKTDAGAPTSAPVLSPVEREAQNMLDLNDEGEIDNVFDIQEEMNDIEQRLPETSVFRARWDVFHEECMQILMDSAKQ